LHARRRRGQQVLVTSETVPADAGVDGVRVLKQRRRSVPPP
jgi:hypothetical protein